MARRSEERAQPRPVVRSVGLIGARWALPIVRDAFDGVRRFGDFQRSKPAPAMLPRAGDGRALKPRQTVLRKVHAPADGA